MVLNAIMETIESFSEFLRKMGVPNCLAVGVVIIVLWLFVSGLRKGLKKGRKRDRTPEDGNEETD